MKIVGNYWIPAIIFLVTAAIFGASGNVPLAVLFVAVGLMVATLS